ncbi:ABC transporter permease [Propionicimonas sp.]|uniref:ABC transporter permease n=1 Tax=Propionicimonas sp. TaxID=1955623 RepID=UPI0017FCB3F6|nr:ABC transporter permease [Propionicimonas sp.]MBU3975672.1 ABC transporter permease [Actinomycetota bacterium]MBA3019925.1 ABC transporter permease [Propionicimonas sp.]MBU3986179.1 ABC transporter permease [Actinomycetota bacterium]MBU4007748.1 ABC transporter permease [Actinomycetota bacterium]MBU4064006.1 ABC transporter permease [Actinomycetota bacterium]
MTTNGTSLQAKPKPQKAPTPEEFTLWSKTRDGVVKYGFVAVTVLLFGYFALTQSAFATSDSLFAMLKYASVTAILGLGMTFSMVVGGMDMSIGSQAGLAVQLAAMTMVFYNMTGVTAGIIVVLGGVLVGLANAVLIVYFRIPDLLATLAMMFVIQGVKLIPVSGQSVSAGMVLPDGSVAPGRFTEGFLQIDRGMVGPVPLPVVIMLLLAVFTWFFLSRTRWGRLMYAVGANPQAARLSGVRVGFYRGLAYVLTSLLASVGGLILVSRIGQGDVNAGSSSLLEAVAVALVGTSVLGANKPNAWGTLLGALLISIVLTGMTMMGFQYYYQDTAKGLVLLVALVFSYTMSRKRVRFTPAT